MQTETSVDVSPKVYKATIPNAQSKLPNTESIKGFESNQVDIVTQIDAFPGEIIIQNEKNASQEISTVREREQISPGGTMRDKLNSFMQSASPKNEENMGIKSPTHVTIEKIAPTEISTRTFK